MLVSLWTSTPTPPEPHLAGHILLARLTLHLTSTSDHSDPPPPGLRKWHEHPAGCSGPQTWEPSGVPLLPFHPQGSHWPVWFILDSKSGQLSHNCPALGASLSHHLAARASLCLSQSLWPLYPSSHIARGIFFNHKSDHITYLSVAS